MFRAVEVYWRCANRACELTALATEEEHGLETRVCACGARMRKQGHDGVFSYLDFLREDARGEPGERNREEQQTWER